MTSKKTEVESLFRCFFVQATEIRSGPYPYQTRIATGDGFPDLVEVPTGLGKTEAVVLGWLFRRRFHPDAEVRRSTPRRLVYCLPMRVLVEQTVTRAVLALDRLGLIAGQVRKDEGGKISDYSPEPGASALVSGWALAAGDSGQRVAVASLRGGEDSCDWDAYPERDLVVVGTQDMLLSRALNRGYGMSRFRWPVHFALLNNDCLWVMDEVQLMGSGLATTTQMQAFRKRFGMAAAVRSTWMSATIRSEWLKTVDFAPGDELGAVEGLASVECLEGEAGKRFGAKKRRLPSIASDPKEVAATALRLHRPGTLTLVVVNTVKRAQDIHRELSKHAEPRKGAKAVSSPVTPRPNLVLLHSRFRPPERARALMQLLAPPSDRGTVAVSTQVVEAGVDLSAATLLTDLAPWASMVQRFGRCNRYGEFCPETNPAQVVVVNVDPTKAAPYSAEEIEEAARLLEGMEDVGPSSLAMRPATQPVAFTHVLRSRDIVDLFDTTPDLAGADIDVSRFIREAVEHDVQVFWREFDSRKGPGVDAVRPGRDELCSVPVGSLAGMLKKAKVSAWRFDHLDGTWVRAARIFPGLTLMLNGDLGGYDGILGWTGDPKNKPELQPHPTGAAEEANDDDSASDRSARLTIAQHTDAVVAELDRILDGLCNLQGRHVDALRLGARWHDAGKAHPVFQKAIRGCAGEELAKQAWAKGPGKARYERPGFRHELASALALLLAGKDDLAAYLAAAHHGKVRLSIRSLPTEAAPRDPAFRFARGVWDGDALPETDLGGSASLPATTLDLSFMELGEGTRGPSWLARMLALRDLPDVGIFRLAFLEAVLRAADWRASASEAAHE